MDYFLPDNLLTCEWIYKKLKDAKPKCIFSLPFHNSLLNEFQK